MGQRRAGFTLGAVAVEVIIGDIATTLPAWPGRADAWYLDGFAPPRTPRCGRQT